MVAFRCGHRGLDRFHETGESAVFGRKTGGNAKFLPPLRWRRRCAPSASPRLKCALGSLGASFAATRNSFKRRLRISQPEQSDSQIVAGGRGIGFASNRFAAIRLPHPPRLRCRGYAQSQLKLDVGKLRIEPNRLLQEFHGLGRFRLNERCAAGQQIAARRTARRFAHRAFTARAMSAAGEEFRSSSEKRSYREPNGASL